MAETGAVASRVPLPGSRVPMKEVINRLRVVDVDKYYDTERYNGKRTIL